MRPEPNYLHEKWLAKSQPVMSEKAIVAHSIQDEKTVYYDLLNNFKLGYTLTLLFLCSIFAILVLSFLLHELVHRIRCRRGRRVERRIEVTKRIALVLARFQSKRLSAIAVFVLFSQIFFWHFELFLTNNVKVEV